LSASPVLPSTVAYIFAQKQEAGAYVNDMHRHVLCDWSAAYLPAFMFNINDEAVRLISTKGSYRLIKENYNTRLT